MQSYVKLTNKGRDEVSLPYRDPEQGNRETVVTLKPRKSKIVPWDLLVLFCGDPTERNQEYWKARDEAYENLCLRYGVREGSAEELPNIVATDVDTGDEIPTLLSDPTGDALTIEAPEASDMAMLQRQLEKLQAEITQLAKANAAAGDAPDTEGETITQADLPVDGPTRPKVS